MKTRTIFATLAVPATALGLFAQETVTVMRGQKAADEGVMIAQGAIGGMIGEPGNVRFFTQEFTFNGRPVTGAPYSADEKTESVQTLADGTHIANSTTTRVYRDSQGRTRREMALPSFGGDTQPHTMITISDPVNGTSYTLDSEAKIAHQMPAMAMAAEAKMRAEANVTQLRAGMSAAIQGAVRARDANGTTTTRSEVRIVTRDGVTALAAPKHEDLGANVIEGVNVTGSRETSTIEAGAMGNDRAITITSERWYSPDLKIELKSVHNDPRMSQTTHTVTNISRTEPDATLFQVPSDYKVDEGPKPGGQNFHYEYHQ